MGATEEQMQLLNDAGITHVSYVLILYSIAFILFLCKPPPPSLTTYPLPTTTNKNPVVNVLLHIYAIHAWPDESSDNNPSGTKYASVNGNGNANYMNGRARSTFEAQRIHDAEAFELQGLISEDEDEAAAAAGTGGSSMGPKKGTDEEMGKENSRD